MGTFGQYGGMNSETTLERGRRQHVVFRQSYTLAYEAVRAKDNRENLCGDADAYEQSRRYTEAIKARLATYEDPSKKYCGVRDEYRLASDAVPVMMNKIQGLVSLT